MTRVPRLDSLPASPIDWTDIPLGVGQESNGLCHEGSFQMSHDQFGINPLGPDVRRNPDESWQIISRVPERP